MSHCRTLGYGVAYRDNEETHNLTYEKCHMLLYPSQRAGYCLNTKNVQYALEANHHKLDDNKNSERV